MFSALKQQKEFQRVNQFWHMLHINPSKESKKYAGVPNELADDINEPGR